MLELFYESAITDDLYIPPHIKNSKYTLMEKKNFLEEAIRNGGYYGDNGCWNSILVFDNDKNIYRGRVETLVIKDDEYVYLKFLPKESQNDRRKYTVPGGSFERDIPNDKQAIAECEEEARLKIKNIQPTGITYKDIKPPPKWAINKQPINWNGNYTEVYVGIYDGKFTGHIDKVDEDKFMITGKFYKIDEIYRYLRKEHKDALKIIYPDRFGQNIVVKESGSNNRKFANIPSIKAMIKRIYTKTKKEEKQPTGNQNCLLCTWCVEAWFRGIDMLPRAVYSPTDKIFDFEGYDIIKRPTKITIENKDDIKKFILAAGDRSRFYVHFKWENGNGGHEFLLINIRDEIYLIDAQSNILEKITSPKVSSYFRDADYEKSFIVRVDDKEINTSMLKYNDMEPKEFTPEDMKYIHDNDLIKKEYTDIEGEISINESSESVFDKILKLNDRLNDYEYMVPNNGNPITHIKNDDFIKYYVLLSPNEFEKYKGGVCWDYVEYEAMYFRAKYPNIKFETYYQVIDNRNDNPTHTFLIFEFNKKWYWFESSWKPNCGVYGFDNKSDCIEYIMQKLKLPGKNYGTYICKFDATDATMYGMNCIGYMNYMSFMIKPYKFTNKKIEPIFIYKGHCPDDKEYTMESVIFSTDNIEYNTDTLKPNSDNNILFITGFSGSGKSTLMANLKEKYGNNIITIAGDIFFMVCVYKYRMANTTTELKNVNKFDISRESSKSYIGPVLKRYFDIYYKDINLSNGKFSNKELFVYWEHFINWLYNDVKENASLYRNKIIVVEGIQIYVTNPELYKDHALIITGTSMLKSYFRKANRDIISDRKYDWKHIKTLFTMIPVYLNDIGNLNRLKRTMSESDDNINMFHEYENMMIESSDKSELTKGFKSKTPNFQYDVIDIKNKKCYGYLKDYMSKIKNNPDWKDVVDEESYIKNFVKGNNNQDITSRTGELFVNRANNELIGFFDVEHPSNFFGIEIPYKKYRGYGIGNILLDDAINKYGCRNLLVDKDNKVAIRMYKKRGFKIIKDRYHHFDGSKYWQMTLDESSLTEASSENLFHVSSVKLANTILEPRIPDNFLVRNGYEDNTTERISVCKSIDDCLTAMSRNLKNKDFYVYKLKDTNVKKKTPSVKEVPDSSITNEVWLLEPSEFELVGKIHVTGTKGDGLSYRYGDNTAELYRWKWSYVK